MPSDSRIIYTEQTKLDLELKSGLAIQVVVDCEEKDSCFKPLNVDLLSCSIIVAIAAD